MARPTYELSAAGEAAILAAGLEPEPALRNAYTLLCEVGALLDTFPDDRATYAELNAALETQMDTSEDAVQLVLAGRLLRELPEALTRLQALGWLTRTPAE